AVRCGSPVDSCNDVAALQPGLVRWTSFFNIADQRAVRAAKVELLRELRRDILDDDSEVASDHFPRFRNLLHDESGHVGGNGKADAEISSSRTEDRGVDSNQFTARVNQRAPGISGIDGRIGLNEVLFVFNSETAAACGADDSHRHRAADAER